MTRMTRELSLVLLGAGVLTAGYFFAPALWAEEDPAEKADEKTLAEVGGNPQQSHSSATHRSHGGFMFLYLPIAGGRYAATGPAGTVPRGGFGSMGSGFTAAG